MLVCFNMLSALVVVILVTGINFRIVIGIKYFFSFLRFKKVFMWAFSLFDTFVVLHVWRPGEVIRFPRTRDHMVVGTGT